MTLANQNGTFTAQIGPVDVSNVRQEFDNEIVLMKTLKSGVINATNVTTTTADSTDAFGDAQKTTTQTAATVPAILTFTGANIHTGLNTHNGNVHFENDIKFTEAAADQDIDVSGVNSKHLKIKATDSNGDLQQVARLSVAESVLNGNTFYCSSGQIYFNQASSINYSANSDVVDLKISGRNSKSLLIKNPSDTGVSTNTI